MRGNAYDSWYTVVKDQFQFPLGNASFFYFQPSIPFCDVQNTKGKLTCFIYEKKKKKKKKKKNEMMQLWNFVSFLARTRNLMNLNNFVILPVSSFDPSLEMIAPRHLPWSSPLLLAYDLLSWSLFGSHLGCLSSLLSCLNVCLQKFSFSGYEECDFWKILSQ